MIMQPIIKAVFIACLAMNRNNMYGIKTATAIEVAKMTRCGISFIVHFPLRLWKSSWQASYPDGLGEMVNSLLRRRAPARQRHSFRKNIATERDPPLSLNIMKTIDTKSLIIGFLLSAVLFLAMGLANNATQDVRIVEIDKAIGGSWDAINTN